MEFLKTVRLKVGTKKPNLHSDASLLCCWYCGRSIIEENIYCEYNKHFWKITLFLLGWNVE